MSNRLVQKASKIQCVATTGSSASKGHKLTLITSGNCIEDVYKMLNMTCFTIHTLTVWTSLVVTIMYGGKLSTGLLESTSDSHECKVLFYVVIICDVSICFIII